MGKISAQPHPTLCIQFLNRENNDKNNTFPLGKQICFAIVWGCTETLPKDVKYPFVSRLANVIQGCFTFFPHPLVVNSCINEDIWSFLVD